MAVKADCATEASIFGNKVDRSRHKAMAKGTGQKATEGRRFMTDT